MRKILFIFLTISSLQSIACDICGCANGSSFVGLLPRSGTQFAGIRYRVQAFDSHLNSQLLKTHEEYQSVEFYSRFYPVKNLQILAFVPYNSNQQTLIKSKAISQKKGFGDAIILGHYNILNTFFDTTNTSHIYQSVLIGGGVKLPTGKFEYGYNEEINPNFQLGTGSTDFLLSVIHTIKYHDFGLNSEIGSRISTKSNEVYRFGNRINGSFTAFYSKNWGLFSIMPNIGSTLDYGFRDTKEGKKNSQTGGFSLLGKIGLEMYYRKLSTGFSFQKPLAQNLASGELKILPQYSFHLTFGI